MEIEIFSKLLIISTDIDVINSYTIILTILTKYEITFIN